MTEPAAARALPEALRALHDLARKMAVVAAISGRPAGFLADRLELATYRSPLRAFGLHGLEEWSEGGLIKLSSGVSSWRPTIEAVRDRLLDAVPSPARVEDKGYGITVHWRSAAASGAELDSFAERTSHLVGAIGGEAGLVPQLGKASVELALPLGVDKGTIVTQLCDGLRTACYLGDDLGDLVAFRALDRLHETSGLVRLKMAVTGAEMPEELGKEADIVLDGPAAAAKFLSSLAGRLRRR